MSRILIIAEKPSVAADLARVLSKRLGKFTKDKSNSFFENDHAIITSAVGHLLEQKKPMTPQGKSLPWNFDFLPAIPEKFELEPIKQSADRLKKVIQLAKKADITEIVNACDAGREGELIFHNLVRYGKWNKTIKRLWMQSMTDDSILSAWESLRSEQDMHALVDAAVCRSESDWLIGLNSTRALTILQSRGGFNVTPSGRVQTPTLAILTQREEEIQAFIPEPYSEVVAEFNVKSGTYTGKWIDTQWKKSDNPHSRAERIKSHDKAEEIKKRCAGKSGTVKDETKPVSTIAPLLYDLTSLQREAANRYGFSAKRTLQLAQECYEKHKILTYPRTDSRYLPADYIKVVNKVVSELATTSKEFSSFAKHIEKENLIKPNKRIFDNAKVSDHFAIIPTGKTATLPPDVQKLYDMVLARFLAVFYPPAIFEDTKRTTTISHGQSEDVFATSGRVLIEPGWQAVYGRKKGSTGKEELAAVEAKELASVQSIDVHNSMTKPPARYNEATLLAAMEGAGKLVEDEELRAAMSERGLGTPATRASIIEGLISQEYIAREARELIATRRGMELITLLKKIGLETLTSPELTGDWEHRLKQMEQGKLKRDSFMGEIKQLTVDIVEQVRKFRDDQQHVELPTLPVDCPACHAKNLKNTQDALSCRECKFSIRKAISGRPMSDAELIQLITKGHTDKLDGFVSRFGKPFEATLILDEKFKSKFSFPEREKEEEEKDSEFTSVGEIPCFDGQVYELQESDRTWRVPKLLVGSSKYGLSVSRTILNRNILITEIKQIVAEGKTSLLKGFVSQRTKRAFDAYLSLDKKTGKVGFEFDKSKPKSGAKSKASTKEKTPTKPSSKAKTTTKSDQSKGKGKKA